jgi:spore coat-associated protein N
MSIKKQLAGAVLAAGIGVAAISGGTFALFTASTTNSANTFTAGTVSIQDLTGNGNVFSATQFVSNLAPGDSETGKIKVKNNGNLDAWVKLESATGTGALFLGDYPITLTLDADVVKLAPGAEYEFDVTYSFNSLAGNGYQNATGDVVVKVQAVQARNNTNVTNTAPISWN